MFPTALGVMPATAGDDWRLYQSHGRLWHATHRAIYALENHIAFLEAAPAIDDGYKGPIITRARAEIRGLDATLAAAFVGDELAQAGVTLRPKA